MNGRLDDKLAKRLDKAVRGSVPEGVLKHLRIEPYTDHHGEAAVKLILVLDAERFEEVDRLGLNLSLFENLVSERVDLFPYMTFMREGEAA